MGIKGAAGDVQVENYTTRCAAEAGSIGHTHFKCFLWQAHNPGNQRQNITSYTRAYSGKERKLKMEHLQAFNHPQFGTVRAVEIEGEPWFVGKDIAASLGYDRTDNAVRNHVDNEDKLMHQISASGQMRNMVIINESGLYSLILSSKLPEAKKFKHWVTSEVLPSIRRDGGYIRANSGMSDEEIMARAVLLGQKKIEEQAKRIQEMRPKEIFADRVSASESSILVGDLAKLLKQNGIDMGQKRLFRWLRDKGYLIKYGVSYNLPTQRSMELGLFEIKETTITHADGHISISKTVKVTGKGQVYFVNKFLLKERA